MCQKRVSSQKFSLRSHIKRLNHQHTKKKCFGFQRISSAIWETAITCRSYRSTQSRWKWSLYNPQTQSTRPMKKNVYIFLKWFSFFGYCKCTFHIFFFNPFHNFNLNASYDIHFPIQLSMSLLLIKFILFMHDMFPHSFLTEFKVWKSF
jgi:hypothetical protein